jgi:hypothetical protein
VQASELLTYIKQPHLLKEQDVARLQQLTVDFPYFQSAHLLLSMASKKWDASVFQQSLKKTAILASNRSHLFDLIQKIEKQGYETIEVKEEILPLETKAKLPDVSVKQELDILKSAEEAVESASQKEITTENTQKPVEAELDTTFLEKEIGQQVANSFVEKEILKTNKVNSTKKEEKEQDQPETFTAWLDFLKKHKDSDQTATLQKRKESDQNADVQAKKVKKVVEKTEKDPLQAKKQKQKAIIDKIIESSPGLIRSKEEQKFFAPDHKAKESLLENEHLVTETLAKIYALQGNIAKAVRSYEILSLKYPQKSAYFASLIKKLKNNP